MRLHRLEIQAIGPFAERETIDFADLDQAGLFLLDGPTGAGKSTVLASICYALYGTVPGQRKLDSLQSTLAAPGVRPEVLLEVTVSQRRFEILRWPAHQRPAKRRRAGSDGTTTEQAGVHLREWVDGDWVERSRRNDETGHLLSDVLGLSAEQFMRVVLLPQGEFAAFLNAGSKDRETLLRRLFDTQRFDAVEEWLRGQARSHGEKVQRDAETVDEIRQRLRAALDEFTAATTTDLDAAVVSDDDPDDAAESAAPATDEALLDALEVALQLHLDRAEQTRTELQLRSTAARRQLEELTTRRRVQLAAQQWTARHQQHQDSSAAVQQCTERLKHHAAAQKVLEAADAKQRATEQRRQLQESNEQLRQRLEATPEVTDWAPTPLAEQPALTRWRETLAAGYRHQQRLEQSRADQQKLVRLRQKRQNLQTEIDTLEAGCVQTQNAVTTLSVERDQHLQDLQELDSAPVSLEQLLQDQEHARQKAQAARRAATETAALAEREDELRTMVDRAQSATQAWQDLVQQRLDRAASLLAVELVEGQPCGVCGATEHPAPASTQQLEQISPEKLKEAERARDVAARERTTAEDAVDAARARRDTAQTQAGGLSVEQADADVVAVQEKIAAAEAHQRRRREVDQLREQVVQKLEATQARLTADRESLAAQRSTLDGISTDVTELEQQVAPEDQQLSDRDWQTRQAAVAHLVSEIETVIEKLQQLDQVSQVEEQAQRRLDESLTSGSDSDDETVGFADVEQAREAALSAQDVDAAQQQVDAWRNEAAALAELAEQPDVVAGRDSLERGEPTPEEDDLERAATALEAAEEDLAEAATTLGSVRTTRDQHRELMDQMRSIVERSAEQLARFQELDELLKLVRGEGENAYKMRLGSYVLAGRLEKVAVAASERLAGMTQGRYTIEHDDTAVSGRRAGLDLRIRDHVNDTLRHPSTLSGGEGFMASLALALGLADTVQAEAGGITMDTLFVDEGFGSLDAQTLEQVMEVLDGLQASGRTIGVVSHVEAMKHQIAHRVEVSVTGGGSHLTVVGPPLA